MSEQLYLHFRHSDQIIPLEEVVAGRKKYRRVKLDLSEYLGGDMLLISKRHFAIHEEHGQFFIEDLDSTNGTEVDGQTLVPTQWKKIKEGSEIVLAAREQFTIEVIDEITKDEILIEAPTKIGKGTKLTTSEDRRHFYLNGKEIKLAGIQLTFIQLLYRNTGRTCSFYEIDNEIWFGRGGKDVIRKAIAKIRKQLDKIERGAGENHIRTIRGEGYQLIRKYTGW